MKSEESKKDGKEKVQDSSFQLPASLSSPKFKLIAGLLVLILIIATAALIINSNTDLLGDNVELNCSEGEPLSDDCLREYARDLDLKGKKFDECYEEAKYQGDIDGDFEYGQMIGVRGGPSFFIGEGDVNEMKGFYIGGAREYDYFADFINGVEEKGIEMVHDEFISSEFGSEEGLLAKYRDAYSTKGLSAEEAETKAQQAVKRDLGAYELKDIETQEGIVLGSKDAKVVLMEFSEFDCEYCAKFATETFPKIKSEYIDSGKVRFVFRDFPLAQDDSRSTPSANAARCADEQDGFWDFAKTVFSKIQSEDI